MRGSSLRLPLPTEGYSEQRPNPRRGHWQTLLRARAIENQMYIVACNRVGTFEGASFFGHSCIVDPWGETVIEAGEEEMLVTAEIDLNLVDEVRMRIPVFRDRRPEVYDMQDSGPRRK